MSGYTSKGYCVPNDELTRACGHKVQIAKDVFVCFFPNAKESGYPGSDFYKHCGALRRIKTGDDKL